MGLRGAQTAAPRQEGPLPYEVVPVEGKGLGVVATRAIACGELVMADVPILTFQGTDGSWVRSVNEQFKALRPDEQQTVMALADVGEPKTVAGIIRTNNYPRGVNSEDGVLCPTFSRFNHSCEPNCEQSWDEDANQLQAFACVDIAAGEELCTYFVDVRDPLASRRQILQKVYCFKCNCPVCTSRDPFVERRRLRMQQLGAKAEATAARNPKRAVRMLADLLELYDQAGIRPNVVRKQACELAVELFLQSGDLPQAQEALELSHKFSTLCHGPQHAETVRLAGLLKSGLPLQPAPKE